MVEKLSLFAMHPFRPLAIRLTTIYQMIGIGVILALSGTLVQAAIITVPTDLNPGDQYRLVFITSGITAASSSSIDDYNAFVDSLAKATGSAVEDLNTTWAIIGSTTSIDARDNTHTNDAAGDPSVPIYRLDGQRVADSNADLWDGSINAAISITEKGGGLSTYTWTGTATNGTKRTPYELGSSSTYVGASFTTSSVWISAGYYTDPAVGRPVYAMSGVLTVVPEPASFGVVLLMMVGLSGIRCSQQQ